jgi:hypothetical protein
MSFQVNQNGSIPMALRPSPIIYAEDAGIFDLHGRYFADEPQQSVTAGWNRQMGSQLGSGFTSQSVRRLLLSGSQSQGSASIASHYLGKTFSKRLVATSWIITEKTLDQHFKIDRPLGPG